MNLAEYFEYKKTEIHIVPGTHILKFLDGLPNSLKQKTSMWRTEFGAGYGALATSILGRSVATLMVMAGPGITNILTVLAQAYNDRIPLVAIGVNNWSSTLNNRVGTIHELGFTNSIFEKVTVESVCINNAKQFCENINRLYNKAWAYRMPVYIDLPSDILDDVTSNEYSYFLEDFQLPKADKRFVIDCANMLVEAQSPVLLCGWAAIEERIQEKVFKLSEWLNLPIITTIEASSFFSHENSIGPIWDRIFIHEQYANKVDAVLSIGCDLGLLETANGKLKFSKHLGVNSKVCNNYLYREGILECDIEEFLDELLISCREKKIIPFSNDLIWQLHNERAEQFKRFRKNYVNHQVFSDIQMAYPENTVFCTDVFLEGYAFAHFWDITRNQKLISSPNYVNLGFSMGVAIGASLLGHDAVCLIGDGGFGYYFTEISTIQKYQKKVKILLFNNNCFGTIRCFAKGNSDIYHLDNPNYASIAKAYNLYFARTNGMDIGNQIQEAEASGLGYIIEINLPTTTPMFNRLKWF